jgi:FAD/FMN-containing dehydrogenase
LICYAEEHPHAWKSPREPVHQVSVRSSGHHCAALSLCQNGLVIDVSALIDLKIVPEKQVAHVQPGVRTGQLYQKLAKHKLHFPAGHISSVGCSGFLLHGGSGFNTRALGFACDNALSFRVAVPAGKDANTQQSHIVTASPTENPDLYWACRGGASFVGVVTSMCIRLVSSTEVIPTVFASVPLSELKHAWSIWKTAVDTSPATLQPMMVLNTDEKGDKCAAIAFYDFSVAEADQIGSQHAVNACLQSLQKVAHCKIDFQASELPYLDALSTLNATGDFPNQCVYNSSAFVAWKKADGDFIDVVMR